MDSIVIFGVGDFAQLAAFYIEKYTSNRVACFVLNKSYIDSKGYREFCGKSVVAFEDIDSTSNLVTDCLWFAPISPRNMHEDRKIVIGQLDRLGVSYYSYVSEHAIVDGKVGKNCFIFENNVIQPFVEIGDHCVLWSGNHVGHHSKIGSFCTLTSHVVISGHCTIEDECFFGVNSTVRDGVALARGVYVPMGGVVKHGVDEEYITLRPGDIFARQSKLSSKKIGW